MNSLAILRYHVSGAIARGEKEPIVEQLTMRVTDPMLDEMRDLLAEAFPDVDKFDREAAIWWFANDWHTGQWSNLYSALSISPYHPSPMETGPRDVARDCYDVLVQEYRHL
jgi:hypothetical protein